MADSRSERDRIILAWALARLDAAAFAVAGAVVAGLALFALTAVVVLKGAPPGVPVGPHLALLGDYLPGYTVSLRGALVGAGYAAAAGAVCALAIAALWNLAHRMMFGLLRTQATLDTYSID